jgi:hypothetical protein
MRAQHQAQMTVHVRKLNRGINNQQAKQQKPVPGAEFQKNSRNLNLNLN